MNSPQLIIIICDLKNDPKTLEELTRWSWQVISRPGSDSAWSRHDLRYLASHMGSRMLTKPVENFRKELNAEHEHNSSVFWRTFCHEHFYVVTELDSRTRIVQPYQNLIVISFVSERQNHIDPHPIRRRRTSLLKSHHYNRAKEEAEL